MFFLSRTRITLIVIICLLGTWLSIPSLFPRLTETKFANLFISKPVNLGLDLKGGAYLLLEVQVENYLRDQMQHYSDRLRDRLRNSKIGYNSLTTGDISVSVMIDDEKNIKEVKKIFAEDFDKLFTVEQQNKTFQMKFNESAEKLMRKNVLEQTLEIVRRRVDETGTKEIDLQQQGSNYVLLQVPGLKDPKEIRSLLGKTAKMTFHLVDESVSSREALSGKLPFGSKVLPFADSEKSNGAFIVVKSRASLNGDMLSEANASVENGSPVVNFVFNSIGARVFADLSTKNIGKQLAIVLDGKVISAPVIQVPILGGKGHITGNFTVQTANELALLLRAGALPAPLTIIEERSVGPSLGEDSIEAGKKAVIAGVLMVMCFMYLFYGVFGLAANVALVLNLFLILAVLSLFGATLTLPGIAGMVLTLGMAVDANVLIFERVREEMRKGNTPLASLESGYHLAFGTIFDSNLTTVIAAMLLYIFATGPVKGFAVTLTIGILCSMFTAISVTKILIGKWYRWKKPKVLPL